MILLGCPMESQLPEATMIFFFLLIVVLNDNTALLSRFRIKV